MLSRKLCAVCVTGVSIGAPGAVAQSLVADIPAMQSATVFENDPQSNFGGGDSLQFGFPDGDLSSESLSYVMWDIKGNIPAGSTVEAVNIIFQKDCSLSWGTQEYNFGIVRVPWSEDTLTWETRPQGIDKPIIVGVGFVGDCATTQQEWRLVFSVLGTWVQGVLDDQLFNGGLEFRLPEDQTDFVRVLSEEGGEAPRLLVQYIPPPCPFDLTTKNVNPGEPGYGEPDGEVDGFDLSFFVEAWLGQNLAADLNTANTTPGDEGYGQPDGKVDGADLSYFVEGWLGRCA